MSAKEHLISVVPEMVIKTITYDLDSPEEPKEGDFIVSIGKERRVGTVYQVISARLVNSKVHDFRWSLKVAVAPDMKPFTTVDYRFNVKVKDQHAWPLFWYPRNKRKAKI